MGEVVMPGALITELLFAEEPRGGIMRLSHCFIATIKHMKNKGFTLIELLVVIAIIGILSSVVLASLNSARAKSRDARRVADLRQLKIALEMYFNTNNAYPQTPSGNLVSNCDGDTTLDTALAGLVSGGFLSKIPKDSLGNWPYCFYYQAPASYGGCPGATSFPYLFIFTTEQTTYNGYVLYGTQGESGSKARYCIYP
jgi:general secretion pathway protein G